ncbi:MAG: hypothetical protein WC325_10265 [Candidatus Bathyarchaeia archaeon]|jgi:hypothetical protein
MTCCPSFDFEDIEQAKMLVQAIKKLCKPNSRFEFEDVIRDGSTVTLFFHRKGSLGLTVGMREKTSWLNGKVELKNPEKGKHK